MQIDVHNANAEKVGTVDVPEEIFGEDPKVALMWEQVRAQRASRRRGTHSTKTRDMVSGTGAKPFKQKGSGNARQGSRRAPHFVGGGVVMGPRPRSYAYRLPRSARKEALRSALAIRYKEENIFVLDLFSLESPKTKDVASFLKRLGTNSALFVDAENDNLKMSTKNLPKSKFLSPEGINVYDILNYEKLVVTKAGLAQVVERALKKHSAARADQSRQ